MPTLSVLIPAYNEAPTIAQVLTRVAGATLMEGVQKEILVIDDGSTDETRTSVEAYLTAHPDAGVRLLRHPTNRGKGAALQTGIAAATGDFLIIQDADLEYDPREYALMLAPMLDGMADVVYGSRFRGGKPHRVLFFWHSIGNHVLTFLSNAMTGLNLTDMETGYKLFRREVLQGLRLREQGFGFEPEVTAKVARIPDVRIYEVGISYYGRTYAEGKKINWRDGVRAMWCIAKYGRIWRS